MIIFRRIQLRAVLLGLVSAIWFTALASAVEQPLYESDPTLSLIGNCTTIVGVDPVPDPSCAGNPLAYPPPPGGPTGQFDEPRAIAIDQHGDQYVSNFAAGDDAKGRVDVFDDEGKFITEFAAPDIKTAGVDSKGNFYAFRTDGDVVRYSPSGDYEPEEGNIEYGSSPVLVASGAFQGSVAVDAANDQVLIARDAISLYKSAAEGNEFVKTYEPNGLIWTESMTIDAQRRRIYVSFCANSNENCGVKILDADAPEEVLETIDGSTTPSGQFASLSGRLPIAVDEGTGDFFIADLSVKKIYRFSESYEFLSQQEFSEMQAGGQIAISNGTRPISAEPCGYPTKPAPSTGDACNRHYLFVTVFKGKGRLAAFRRPNQTPPVIEAVSTPGIGETEAELRAAIFPGGLETTYRFDLLTQAQYEANGNEWSGATIFDEGTIPAESLAIEVSAFATGLAPGQTYRFRVVAENELGPAEEEGQNEAAFTTYDNATISPSCPNEAFRVGPSALLPDCRAYELVTPVESNGRPPKGVGELGSTFSTLQASPAGDAVSFKIEGGSLPGSSGIGSFEGDPYVSKRTASGWTTELAGPNGSEATVSAPASVSPDQGYQFWRAREEGPLVIPGQFYTEYLYYPDGHSELIGRGSEGIEPRAQGKLITENATHVVFQSLNLTPDKAVKLEPNAPPEGTQAVYDRPISPGGEEQTYVVSLLPGDVTPAAGENASFLGASKDGEGIAFELGNVLYLRLHNETTFEIGEEVEFAGVSEGGARIFFLEEGDLEAFDTASEGVIDFATSGDAIPVNVAAGGTRAYFISPSVLGGANPQGDTPVPPASGQGTFGAKGAGTLSAAKGEGTLEAESKKVTGVFTGEGAFQIGMQITGAGIPEGTTIKTVGAGTMTLSQVAAQSGTAVALAAGSTKVTALTTSQGVFQVGMEISGTGIPAGTSIAAVAGSTLTLSKAATQPGVGVALTAGSTVVTGVSTGEGVFRVGMNLTAPGILTGTVITAIDETAHTLTLSKEAATSGTQPLSAFAQNLYLSEEGSISFLATVTGRDAEGEPAGVDNGLGLWTKAVGGQLARDPSRTNPDGSVLLFQSRAEITGYPESKFPQIYRYDATASELQCISCIPTGRPATGGARLESYSPESLSAEPFSVYGYVANTTPDGTRAFFESTEALVSADTDKVTDVYEWEANGTGSCARPAGCLYLISSGQSARDNFLYGHSTNGEDVFFTTGDQLTDRDNSEGSTSIYDARVGGGFSEPEGGEVCTADGCRPQVTPLPAVPSSKSSAQGRSGNVAPQQPKTCPKGKRKVKQNGKVRCVKKQKKQKGKGKAKQRAGANRGAGK